MKNNKIPESKKLISFDWAIKRLLRSKVNFGEEIKDSFKAKGLLEAKEKLDYMKLSESERKEYQRYLENKMYQNSMVDSSFRDGKIEGREEGEKNKSQKSYFKNAQQTS